MQIKCENVKQQVIQACRQAIVVLSEHHPELAQVRNAAHLLQTARLLQLVLSAGTLGSEKVQVLKDFLQQAQGASSFLAAPGLKSYAPQSGQIFRILEQMAEISPKPGRVAGAGAEDQGGV